MQTKKRLIILATALFFCFSLLIAAFFRIQIQEGRKWRDRAERQHFFQIKEPFKRGLFYSNVEIKQGHPNQEQSFVIDVQKFHLSADPMGIPKACRSEVAEGLAALLKGERDFFLKELEKKSRNRQMARWLSKEQKEAVLEWWLPFAGRRGIAKNALFFTADYQRSYPFGKLLGQVLHTVREKKEEATMRAFPTGGLEYALDGYLQGKQGVRRLMRSPKRCLETGEVLVRPEDGADVYLTINHYLQAIAEEELEKGVKRARAKGGWAVVLDPRTGHLLALAQYPFFFPEKYSLYFGDRELEPATRMRAVMDAYEPGSVLKPFTAATALLANELLRWRGEEPLFDPESPLQTLDGNFPGRSKPIREISRCHKRLNLDMAIQRSSNIYSALLAKKIVERLGNEWLRSVWEEQFGFGEPTGVELPAEHAGLLPRIGRTYPGGKLEWSAPTPYSLAMGHNIQLNSLQLARAYALFANGGRLVRPTLVKKMVKGGSLLVDHSSEAYLSTFPQTLDARIADRVLRALKYVTKEGGSGWRGDVPGYSEAGKSGTSMKIVKGEYSPSSHYASFAGLAPLTEDALVIVVTLDEPEVRYLPGIGKNHHGGVAAAPIFREIAKRSLEYLGVKPDDPFGYPEGDPRRDGSKASWVKEAKLLQEKYDSWNK